MRSPCASRTGVMVKWISRQVNVLDGFLSGSKTTTMPSSTVTGGGLRFGLGSGNSLARLELPSGRRVSRITGRMILTLVTAVSPESNSWTLVRHARNISSK